MDFSYVHISYPKGYLCHICLQDTIQSHKSFCLLCQAMLLPLPLRPLLLTIWSGFMVAEAKIFRLRWALGIAESDRSSKSWTNSKISSPGGIAKGVQVPTLRTSSAPTPWTGQGPQKRAKPQVATNPMSSKSPNVPFGAPHPRDPIGVPALVGEEMDSHPRRELSGPQLPCQGTRTVISTENRLIIESSIRVIEQTNAAPSRAAE